MQRCRLLVYIYCFFYGTVPRDHPSETLKGKEANGHPLIESSEATNRSPGRSNRNRRVHPPSLSLIYGKISSTAHIRVTLTTAYYAIKFVSARIGH